MVVDIIAYVDVEEVPVRYSTDGMLWMDSDFRWHEVVAEAEEIVREAGRNAADAHSAIRPANHCVVCGEWIPPTGKPGRPASRCGGCKNIN